MPESDKKAVVLLSGGLDSATCLALARAEGYRCHALSFDYGQRSRSELQAAAAVAQQLGAEEHRVINVDMRAIGGSALTDMTLAVPESESDGIPITYVPARNTVFLAYALAWAEVLQANAIFIGVNALDYSGYPDCRDETMRALQSALRLGMANEIQIETPLMWLDKAATWQLAEQLGGAALIELIRTETHTCYLGERGELHKWGYGCGHCPACELRARGYAQYLADRAAGAIQDR